MFQKAVFYIECFGSGIFAGRLFKSFWSYNSQEVYLSMVGLCVCLLAVIALFLRVEGKKNA